MLLGVSAIKSSSDSTSKGPRFYVGALLVVVGLTSILAGWLATFTVIGAYLMGMGLLVLLIGGAIAGSWKGLLIGLGSAAAAIVLVTAVANLVMRTVNDDDDGDAIITPVPRSAR